MSLVAVVIVTFFTPFFIENSNAQNEEGSLNFKMGNDSDKDYNATLYGHFVKRIFLKGLEVRYHPDGGRLSFGEKKKIHVNISYKEPIVESAEMKKLPFYAKFIVIKNKTWELSTKQEGGHSFGDVVHWSPEYYGKEIKNRVITQSNWYEELPRKTENVYDLDYQSIEYTPGYSYKTTNFTVTIEQGGHWKIAMLARPKGGNYWVKTSFEIFRVSKPGWSLIEKMPYAFPVITLICVMYINLSITHRKKPIRSILKKLKKSD